MEVVLERVIVELARQFLNKGYEVKIITFEKIKDKQYDYSINCEICCINLPGSSNYIKKLYTLFKRIQILKNIKKKYKPKVSISFLDNANLINAFSKKNEVTITSVRSFLSSRSNGFFYKVLIKMVAKRSDKMIAISELVKQDLIGKFGIPKNKLKVIYNPCEITLVRKLAKEFDSTIELNLDFKYIVTVGRLMKPKGHWHLLKAFSLVHKNISNTKLIIIGEGELLNELKTLAIKLEIIDYVIFTGFMKNPFFYIKKSHIFVFTSIFEGLGNVLLEALALDKAIVSTDCDAGPREILAPSTECNFKTRNIEYAEYGILVPSFNPNGNIDIISDISIEEQILSKALCKLLLDDSLRTYYEKKAKERISLFDSETIINKWIDLINVL